jgi:hypothetical protein
MRIEVPMPEQTTYKNRGFADVHSEMDDAVMCVTKTAVVKVVIAAEESRSALLY